MRVMGRGRNPGCNRSRSKAFVLQIQQLTGENGIIVVNETAIWETDRPASKKRSYPDPQIAVSELVKFHSAVLDSVQVCLGYAGIWCPPRLTRTKTCWRQLFFELSIFLVNQDKHAKRTQD